MALARPNGHTVNNKATSNPYTTAMARLAGRTANAACTGSASPSRGTSTSGKTIPSASPMTMPTPAITTTCVR